jgi:hypothetical protein
MTLLVRAISMPRLHTFSMTDLMRRLGSILEKHFMGSDLFKMNTPTLPTQKCRARTVVKKATSEHADILIASGHQLGHRSSMRTHASKVNLVCCPFCRCQPQS